MGPSFTNNPSEFNLMASPSPPPGMEIQPPALLDEDPSTYSSAMWDWVIALRVTPIKLPSHPFVEGLLPCSYPELDQKLEEAERLKKKRDPREASRAPLQAVKVPSSECTEQSNSPSILGNLLHNLETLVKKMKPDSLVHCTCDCDRAVVRAVQRRVEVIGGSLAAKLRQFDVVVTLIDP
ncbi:hypothetical protein HID58_088519 [Brassica napus]|uniref:Uncharacterized protein n=1 Tax=Brassica napus TaxID=3708 RepID=A0ABQ7XWE9_BRANA|nr:hypothetical protein HID58_088519 [Brassica napus]